MLRCSPKVPRSLRLQHGLMLRRGWETLRSPTLQHGLILRCGREILRSLVLQRGQCYVEAWRSLAARGYSTA